MNPPWSEITACRTCGSARLAEVLNLGFLYLSDFQDNPNDFTERAPLVLVRCEDCTLVQLRHTVERDRLYSHYWYRSATQPSMVKALQNIVWDAASRVSLQPGDVVLDIGANDGTLLEQYSDDLRRWGVEPSPTFEAPRWAAGWATEYWPIPDLPVTLGAKIITSAACFYDVDDPSAFVAGIKAHLAPDGVWINQMAYLPDTLKMGNFGDICHEHLTYWTVSAFANLLERHGLMLETWSHNDVNGGSVRLVVRHNDSGAQHSAVSDPVSLIDMKRFGQRMRLQRSEVRSFLHNAKRQGLSVIGYGASTKGNTYLQYWDIGPDLLPYIADRNPDKYGKYTPTGQRVISEADARAMRPAYFFALPFHFIEAFVEREADFLRDGGQFIVPFPELHTIGAEALDHAA